MDPADTAALAGRLLRVLRDRDLAERLGAAGRQRALERFTEARAVERFESIYARLVVRGGSEQAAALQV